MGISGRNALGVFSAPGATMTQPCARHRRWASLIATLALAVFVHVSNASIIVSWDASRGGASSLADDAGYAATRTMIATDFPATTIVGVPTISTASLAGASVVWLGSDFGDTSAITPLDASEQSALLTFVQGGGTVLLFGENDTYAPDAPATNNSLFSPFGVHITGTLSHTQGYTFPSPASFPLTGPFGTVSSLSSNYAGWFDSSPVNTSVVADLSANGQPVIATLPAGAVGDGSGAVWLFGDSGSATAGGIASGDWNTLYANILSGASVPEPTGAACFVLIGCGLLVQRKPRGART